MVKDHRLVDLYGFGHLLLDEMVAATYKLDEIEQGFADMLAGKNSPDPARALMFRQVVGP